MNELLNIARWKLDVTNNETFLGFNEWSMNHPLNTNIIRPIHGGYATSTSLQENRNLVSNNTNSNLTQLMHSLQETNHDIINTIMDLPCVPSYQENYSAPNDEEKKEFLVTERYQSRNTFEVLGEIDLFLSGWMLRSSVVSPSLRNDHGLVLPTDESINAVDLDRYLPDLSNESINELHSETSTMDTDSEMPDLVSDDDEDSSYVRSDDEEHMNLGEPSPYMLEQERYGFTEDIPVIALKHTFNGREFKYYYEWDPNTETPENLITIQSMIIATHDLQNQMPNIFINTEEPSEFNGGFIYISDGSKPENGGICFEHVWNNSEIETDTRLVSFLQIMDSFASKLLELISTQQVEEFDEEDLEDIPIRLSEDEYNEYIQIIPTSLINKSINSGCTICTICQDKFTDSENCHVISCGHAYHEECLKHWLIKTCQRPTCPNCRHDSREMCENNKGNTFTFESFDSNFDLKNFSFGTELTEDKIFVFGAQ